MTGPGPHAAGRGPAGAPPPPRAPGRLPAPVVAGVAVGGFCGTLLRYAVSLAFPSPPAGFDAPVLALNAAGCLALGLATGWWAARPGTRPWLRAALGPGLLGSFTTFSAVALQLSPAGWGGGTAAYAGATVVAGIGAAAAGLAAGRALAGRASPGPGAGA